MSISCPWFIGNHPILCVPVDHYCERTSASLSAEPVNALTNIAFLIAAWLAWKQHQRHRVPGMDGLVDALIVTMAVVGLGSFLFHTVGTRWSEWGDVLPIMVFMMLYLWLALTLFFSWPTWLKAASLLLYFAATFYMEAAVPATALWGGMLYVPTLIIMVAVCLALYRRRSAAAGPLIAAAGVFLLSFSARTLDAPICPTFSLGTHFLWHLLNATTLYLLVRATLAADQRGFQRLEPIGQGS